ncbi:MAG: ABC transporter ATP-binding protein [Mycobacteriales bacterium]
MAEPTLAVQDVCVRFGSLSALEGVSLEVGAGEIVGVIGPNGAGKTTLFNVICGFVAPESGVVSYQGRRLARIRPHQLARLGISRTLQGLGLWAGLTVRETVMAGATARYRSGVASALLGLPPSTRSLRRQREQADKLLEELELTAVADRAPDTLSYGVQKRVVFARALAGDPQLLLLDEPASGLSAGELEELAALLRRLVARTAILLVEHHMDLVMSVCDRIVVLDFGRRIAAGTPEVIRADPAVTSAYLGDEVTEDTAAPG